MKKRNSHHIFLESGFTIIQLVVVVGIIIIFLILSREIFNPEERFAKEEDARRKKDLQLIQNALETYYRDFGKYPDNDNEYRIQVIQDGRAVPISWGDTWIPYLELVPKDPKSPRKWYVYVSSGQTYHLYASLTRAKQDSQACNHGLSKCDQAPDNKGCGTEIGDICSYGVTSSNTSP